MDQLKNVMTLSGNQTSLSPDLHVIVYLSVILITIDVYTVCSNGAILIAMVNAWTCFKNHATHRTAKKYSLNKVLLTSLASCDMCIGLIIMPLSTLQILHNGNWIFGRPLCFFMSAMDLCLGGVSILHVSCLALDRYLAIRAPLRHRLLTYKTGWTMIALCWLLPIVFITSLIVSLFSIWKDNDAVILQDKYQVCFIPGFDADVTTSLVTLFLLLYTTTLVLVFLTILELKRFFETKFKPVSQPRVCNGSKTVRSGFVCKQWVMTKINNATNREGHDVSDYKSKRSRPQSGSARMTPSVISTVVVQNVTPSARLVVRRVDSKAIFTMCSLVACFSVCYVPYHMFLLFPDSLHVHKMEFLPLSVVWLTYLNSAINPALYCLNRSARQALLELLCRTQSRLQEKQRSCRA